MNKFWFFVNAVFCVGNIACYIFLNHYIVNLVIGCANFLVALTSGLSMIKERNCND